MFFDSVYFIFSVRILILYQKLLVYIRNITVLNNLDLTFLRAIAQRSWKFHGSSVWNKFINSNSTGNIWNEIDLSFQFHTWTLRSKPNADPKELGCSKKKGKFQFEIPVKAPQFH